MRRFAAVVLALGLVAAACGGGDDTDEAKSTGDAVTTTAPLAPGETVAPGSEDTLPEPGGAPIPGAAAGAPKKTGTGGATATTAAPTSVVAPNPPPVPGKRPATENRTGITATSIKLGHHWPETGPFGPLLRNYIAHFELYFTGKGGLNERGGVFGRKVEPIDIDDKGNPAGGATAAKELEDAGVFTAYGHSGVEQQVAVLSHFERKKIPYIANGLMSTHVKPTQMGFTFLTPWDIVARTMPSFVINKLNGKGQRIALIWERPDWPVPKDAFLAEAKAAGLNIVHVEPVEATQASYVSNVDSVRSKDPKIVVLIGRLSVPGILRDARLINFQPTWTGFGAWTLNLFNTASGGLTEGIKAIRQWWGVDSPKYKEYVTFLRNNGRGDEASEEGYGGWMIGFFYENLLKRAGPDPTRESLLEGIFGTNTTPIPLIVTPPIRYAPTRHWMSEEALPVQVKDGAWVRTGDFARRF